MKQQIMQKMHHYAEPEHAINTYTQKMRGDENGGHFLYRCYYTWQFVKKWNEIESICV